MKKILLSSIVAIAVLTGCGEEKKTAETKTTVEEVKQEVAKVEQKAEETQTSETKLVEQVKDSATKVAQKLTEESKKVAEIVPDAVKSVTDKVVAKTEEVTKEVITKTEAVTKEVEKMVAKTDSVSLVEKGQGLYLKCAGCHGSSAEKPALGKSQVIKGWDAAKIVSSLKGYKDGTYGGVMKGVMKGQVTNLSDEEIEALGAYIATF